MTDLAGFYREEPPNRIRCWLPSPRGPSVGNDVICLVWRLESVNPPECRPYVEAWLPDALKIALFLPLLEAMENYRAPGNDPTFEHAKIVLQAQGFEETEDFPL